MPAQSTLSPVTIRDAQIRFRNFSGKAQQYNAEGDRNFCVFLEDDLAVLMSEQGWNIKFTKPREDDPEQYRQPYIQVTVKFGFKPPRVVTVTQRGKVDLDEGTVKILDFADIAKADLIFIAYAWDINGKQGVTAYLKSLFVTLNEDELEQEYGMVPDVATPAVHDDFEV